MPSRGRPRGSKNKPKQIEPRKPPTLPTQITRGMMVRFHKLHGIFNELRHDPNPHRRFPTYKQLAIQLGYSRSTIIRDIAVMRYRLNLPLDEIKERGGWGYTRDVGRLPNIFITEGDLLILCASWGVLEGQRNTSFSQRVRPVMEKLMEALGHDLSFDFTSVSERIVFRSGGYHANIDITIFETVVGALLSQHELEFTYRKPSTDGTLPAPENRRARPRCLACIDHAWYIFVDDLDRDGKSRKFALYRMQSATDTCRRFEPEGPFDFEAALNDSLGVHTDGEKATVELHFKPSIAGYARETFWHKTERFTDEPDGSLRLQMDVLVNGELEAKIQRWGSKVEVLNPPKLREKFAGYAREAMAMYGVAN